MGFVLYTVFLPILPNAKELMPIAHEVNIPDHSGLSGFAMIVVILFGAVRGFALLTGFEASVAGLSHEEDKPRQSSSPSIHRHITLCSPYLDF